MVSKTLKKIGFICTYLLLVLVLSVSFAGQAEAARKKKRSYAYIPPYADLVIDAETGRILRERSGQASRYPASLTKMMTLYLAFQAIENGVVRLDSRLPVSRHAQQQAPSKLGLRAGQSIRVYDAIMALVTKSANDAAVVLAEGLAGSESHFVVLMNEQARALGMRRTRFRNPSGLPDKGQVTTARDMAILGVALISHYPGFYPYFSHQSFDYQGMSLKNHNHLMSRYAGMDGIKTGYINASGFNLVASAMRNGTRLVGVIFGGQKSKARDQQMAKLLDASFAFVAKEKRLRRNVSYGGASIEIPSKIAAAFPSTRPALLHVEKEAEKPEGARAWGVQVGAFSDVLSARQLLLSMMRNMSDTLQEAQPSLQKVTMTDGSTVYRARFVGLDQDAARSVCSNLIRHGRGCLLFSGS